MPKIDSSFVESLLHEEEGVTLDFKRAQYPFVRVSDADKSELLKDILAFANAWRRADAFILIGVEEVKGARSRVLGITEHLEDASLQQFVNTKTQRPISFSYTPLQLEGSNLGIIHIPLQERPFYLERRYGKLEPNTVYIRRGSSTGIASPDEISRMGSRAQELTAPRVEVFFAEPSVRQRLEDLRVDCLALEIPDAAAIPDHHSQGDSPFSIGNYLTHNNRDYYRDLATFTQVQRLLSPVYLAVANHGSATAHDLRIELRTEAHEGLLVLDEYGYPKAPRPAYSSLGHTSLGLSTLSSVGRGPEVSAQALGGSWLIEARTDKVQPKSTCWFDEAFFIGSTLSRTVEFEVTVFADNLAEPHTQSLTVQCATTTRIVDLGEILDLEKERDTKEAVARLKSQGIDVHDLEEG